jgi:hypothetical protein
MTSSHLGPAKWVRGVHAHWMNSARLEDLIRVIIPWRCPVLDHRTWRGSWSMSQAREARAGDLRIGQDVIRRRGFHRH